MPELPQKMGIESLRQQAEAITKDLHQRINTIDQDQKEVLHVNNKS